MEGLARFLVTLNDRASSKISGRRSTASRSQPHENPPSPARSSLLAKLLISNVCLHRIFVFKFANHGKTE